MRVSNKTTQEYQKQARTKIQLLIFENRGSTSKNSYYELTATIIPLFLNRNLSFNVDEFSH